MKKPDKVQLFALLLIVCSATALGRHYYQVHHADKLYEETIRQAKPEETETRPVETLELETETKQYVSPIDFNIK